MEDAPAKRLMVEPINKENMLQDSPVAFAIDYDSDLKKHQLDPIQKEKKPSIEVSIKAMEAEEPILKENPHRFVMFPIKYYEVSVLDPRHA